MKWKEIAKAPLREFAEDQFTHQLSNVAQVLQKSLGKFQRVGGSRRVYEIEGTAQKGIVYVVGNSTSAIGLGFAKDMIVETIYLWHEFSINNEPNYSIDLPDSGDFEKFAPIIINMLNSQTIGPVQVPSGLAESKLNEARRTSDAEFIQMARNMFGAKANSLTLPDLMAVAKENDVQIPSAVRHSQDMKVDAHHWNLSGSSSEKDDAELSNELGAPIDQAPSPHPEYSKSYALSKVQDLKGLAGRGLLYLMGKKPNDGKFFKVPHIEELLAQLERMMSRELATQNPNPNGTMEDQYELLEDKVKLIAGGRGSFMKSLLITGAPSSGKSYHVMRIVKELGLVEGEDYIVKKGRITVPSMYRTLIEQVNGLVIFDDCDSVVEDKNGINMLKGALDTNPVREISYDLRGTINTAVMRPELRDEYVERLSRVLRGNVAPDDAEFFAPYAKIKGDKKKEVERHTNEDGEDEEYPEEVSDDEATQIIDFISAPNHPPNKIDFKGRVIFISNMSEDEWDDAILTRAFTQNLSFTSDEMLDYIDKVKNNIKANLTEDEKQEVMDFIREQWTLGNIKRPVNFRLVQQAFDLRLVGNWQRLIKML